ncbi:S1 family peptidase [Candidatus Entotheonella palauensis]|uniref:Serine protease n=1 Tax=Candidatus Entotheonella gemina TaxID=1429439 RepID=W4M8M5_9BACT|nr:serine protease [Candidatus Entotheonella palauensis]ETX05982.1 MAG: hypothetical protein ETSY2_19790 [Candidatus Entotheonella gemina]
MCRGLAIVLSGVFIVVLLGQRTTTSAGALSVPEDSESTRLTHPITTVMTFADGTAEVKHGQGFVVGNRLFTVYHNLAPRINNTSPTKREIYVAGTLMKPVYTDSAHDIAIFEIPDALCKPHCTALATSHLPALNPDRQVYWIQKAGGERLVMEGRVQHYAWLSEAPPAFDADVETTCQRNLIVEVDTPFRPGTSGSPIFDATTDTIVGMIQGSLIRAGGDTGYFKPMTCLLPLAQL